MVVAVLLIISITGVVTKFSIDSGIDQERGKQTNIKMSLLSQGIIAYKLDHWDEAMSSLGDLLTKPIGEIDCRSDVNPNSEFGESKGWCGPYLNLLTQNEENSYSLDAWGTPLQLSIAVNISSTYDANNYFAGSSSSSTSSSSGSSSSSGGEEEEAAEEVDVGEVVTAEDGKVIICHYPPGNETGAMTLNVAVAAHSEHLAHGDTNGECGSSTASDTFHQWNQSSSYGYNYFTRIYGGSSSSSTSSSTSSSSSSSGSGPDGQVFRPFVVYELRSCGPDTVCDNGDDIVTHI